MNRMFWIIMAVIGGGLILLVANHDDGQTLGVANDAFARTLYLGIWGAVLAAGILGSGMRIGDIARQLAIWVLIILVLMAGYQYRYELQDVGNRLTAGLIPGSPLSAFDDEGRATVMLDKAGDGHFVVNAEVNNRDVTFLIDTGASRTVLTEFDAKNAGIDTNSLQFTVPVSTANGQTMAARASVDVIAVGQIERIRMPVLVSQRGQLSQSLLGMNFLNTLSGYEVRGDRLILRD